MIRIQDTGELVYGAGVTLADWWDNKRITEGTLKDKEVIKKAAFWTYLAIGVPATLISALGWWSGTRWRGEVWAEHVSHGFIYDFPRFIYGLVQSLGTGAGTATRSNAIAEAQKVLDQRRLSAGDGSIRLGASERSRAGSTLEF